MQLLPMQVFAKFSKILGTVTHDHTAGWVAACSFEPTPTGGRLVKPLDRTSPSLALACSQKAHIGSVLIHSSTVFQKGVCKTVAMNDVVVTGTRLVPARPGGPGDFATILPGPGLFQRIGPLEEVTLESTSRPTARRAPV